MVTTGPSIPVISAMLVTLRVPSERRVIWTTTSMAELICWRIALSGSCRPAMATIVSRRARASRGELEWIVVSDPSWPVFMAWSMSMASSPRTSPTMIRSGRIRRALITSSRWRTAPFPSTLGAASPGEPRAPAATAIPPRPRC
jgi:hypothetical protein